MSAVEGSAAQQILCDPSAMMSGLNLSDVGIVGVGGNSISEEAAVTSVANENSHTPSTTNVGGSGEIASPADAWKNLATSKASPTNNSNRRSWYNGDEDGIRHSDLPPTTTTATTTATANGVSGMISPSNTAGRHTNSPYSPTASAVMASIFDNEDDGILVEDGNDQHNSSLESVSRMVHDLQKTMEERFMEMMAQQRRDFDRVLTTLQSDSIRRDNLNSRVHAQLLLQSESMVAMELKVLRLEAKVERREAASSRQRRTHVVPANLGTTTSSLGGISNIDTVEEEDLSLDIPLTTHGDDPGHHLHHRGTGPSGAVVETTRPGPTLIGAAFVGSGASLASGVTATTAEMDEEGSVGDEDDNGEDDDNDHDDDEGSVTSREEEQGEVIIRGNGEEEEMTGVSIGDSDSTPTQSSNHPRVTNLDSILQNSSICNESAISENGISTRATRPPPDNDGHSSLATSVTNVTLSSTVVTATTQPSRRSDNRSGREGSEVYVGPSPPQTRGGRGDNSGNRSRSQSPLTVQESVAQESSASLGTSVGLSSIAAVAPSRAFASRRAAAAAAATAIGQDLNSTRPITNRVVQFVYPAESFNPVSGDAGDSVTMPDSVTMQDEFDNLSDVADVFATSSRRWREDYESRLDSIQKRWGGEQ